MRTERATWGFPRWLAGLVVKSCPFRVLWLNKASKLRTTKTLFVAKIMPEIVDNFLKPSDLKPFGSSYEAKVTKISLVVPLGFFVDIFILLTSDWLIEMLTF